MTQLLEKAFEALKTLPLEDQERMAWDIIDRVEDKNEWDRLVASPEAQAWLADAAKKALKGYEKVRKKLTLRFVSLTPENMLREGSYWENFDDLPEEVRKLAEKNFLLWKENPKNPGLRFKQIHKSEPIFSFRVGMKHRTVGVEALDGKMVWFWVGSFDTFKAQITQ